MSALQVENSKYKQLLETQQVPTDNVFSQKLLYFAKLNQHAFYDFQSLKWTSFKVFEKKISEGKIVVIDKNNILIVGGYETDHFDWSQDIPSS
jgi:hypothetical protein